MREKSNWEDEGGGERFKRVTEVVFRGSLMPNGVEMKRGLGLMARDGSEAGRKWGD